MEKLRNETRGRGLVWVFLVRKVTISFQPCKNKETSKETMEHKPFHFLELLSKQAQVCSLRQIPLKLRQLDTSSKFHQTTPSSLDFF